MIGFYAYATKSSHPTALAGRLDLHLRLEKHKKLPYGICHARLRLFCLDMTLSPYELNVLWKGTIQI